VSLPGADELFRTTGGASLQAPPPATPPQGDTRLRPVPDAEPEEGEDGPSGRPRPRDRQQGGAGTPDEEHTGREAGPPAPRRPITERPAVSAASAAPVATATVSTSPGKPTPPPITATPQPPAPARRKAPRQNRRPSGRERHDEKITVYVSAEELMDLEHARLVLRGEHGLAIDRGRIVREAVAVVLADLESRGDASILVRRLRGR
jgi:hypothetical protein